MKYSADDIAGQRFEAKMRGYDRAQVEEFLQQVAVEWTRLAEENRRKSKRIEVLGREVRDFRKRRVACMELYILGQQCKCQHRILSDRPGRALQPR